MALRDIPAHESKKYMGLSPGRYRPVPSVLTGSNRFETGLKPPPDVVSLDPVQSRLIWILWPVRTRQNQLDLDQIVQCGKSG